jgi:hypothetical protein
MPFAGGNDAVATGSRYLADHLREEQTMKKLLVLAMAAVFSIGVAQVGYAVAQEKKMEEKKDMGDKKDMKKGEKTEKKDAKKDTKKADKKMDKKDAANPCAAKADKK